MAIIVLVKKFADVEKSYLKVRFGAFYDGLKIENGRKVLLQPAFFLARRLSIGWLVIYGTDELIY